MGHRANIFFLSFLFFLLVFGVGSCTATRVAGSVPEQPHVSDCQCTVYACQGGRSNSDDDDDGDDDDDDDDEWCDDHD